MIHLLIHLFSQFHYGRTQQPLEANIFPLAVRSPYLNCWGAPDLTDANGGRTVTTYDMPSFGSRGRSPDRDPSLKKFDPVVLVRVNNETFLFVGDELEPNRTMIPLINITSGVISPTQTMFTAEAGPMQINLTFLNPIEPGDWVKQSIPLSYISLTANSLDGAAHAVQVYLDISAEWNQSQEIYWTYTLRGDGVVGYTVLRQDPTLPADELSVSTEWGILYNVMKEGDNITQKHGNSSVTRLLFLNNGVLGPADAANGPSDNLYTPNSTVFAMSRDLGTIQVTQDPIVWVIGYTTDPVINYTDLSGTPPQKRSLLYKTQYPEDGYLIYDFMNDFGNASSRAQKLDQKILQDAAPISGLYGYLVSFATAQVYGNTLLTVATYSSGEFNKSDVMAFITFVGGRVNPVEKMYFAFPAFMYIDPDLGGLLLEPLFRLQGSPKYTIPYAAQDLGMSYPDVSISNSPHNQGVEETGNMLIMTYAHARASGNRGLINRYYNLLTSWADYLSNSTLFIHDQYSADGLSTDNQTGLAIKGIIAIKAMSQMSLSVDMTTDFEKYSNTSSRLYAQWKSLALTDDKHLLEVYGDMKSSSLGYDLFPDLWLNTSVVESSVYNGQISFIYNLSLYPDTTGWANYPWWNLFMAAMTPNQDLRTNLISKTVEDNAFFDSAEISLGAMYAPLALKVPVNLTANSTTATPKATPLVTPSKPHTTIRGVSIGVAALLVIVAIALVVWRRRRQSHRRISVVPSSFEVMSQGTQVTVTPFNPAGSTLTEVAPLDAGRHRDSQRFAHHPSSSEDPPVPLRRVVTAPVGLSSKELARLRSLANRPRSRPIDDQPSNSLLTAAARTDRDALEGAAAAVTSSPEVQILRGEVNVLRDEIQRLHTETRIVSESPPSYASGAA